jgi:secreted trypsin-like serine protease
MIRSGALLSILLGLVSCTEATTSSASDPIIGGGPSAATDDAVVMVAAYPSTGATLVTCTGVLIAPTFVLTSAHCIDATNHPGYTFGVFVGADGSAYTTLDLLKPHLLAVTAVHAHPSYSPNPPFPADLGVVQLAAPLTTVTPMALQRTTLPTSVVTQAARLIGYGQTVYQTPNQVRHTAATTVAAIDSGDTITVGDATVHTCLGDSGGPAIVKVGGVDTVIGVDSYTDVAGCTGPAHYTRPDLYDAFISTYVPHGNPAGGDAGVGGDAGTGGGGGGGGCQTGGAAGLLIGLALIGLRRRR